MALVAGVAVAVAAARRPVLWRMAARNARRRPRQTAIVIAGLMVGTAIISAALIAGGSAGSAIRGAVYDALGPVDQTVRLDAVHYFPEQVLHDLRDHPAVAGWFDGAAGNAIWQVAVVNTANDNFQPDVMTIGYDPALDADFGPFHLVDGTRTDGRDLRRGEAIINERLAERLDARVDDTLLLRYTPPMDPIVPEIIPLQGTLQVSLGGGLPGIPLPASSLGQTHAIEVAPGAVAMTVVVGWDPRIAPVMPPTASLHLRLVAPDGSVHEAPAPGEQPALPPVWMNVTAPGGGTLAPGTWRLTVSSPAAVQVEYEGAAVVLYPVYDATEFLERTRGLEEMLHHFEDHLPDLSGFGEPRTHTVRVAAITDGGRGKQFDFRHSLFWLLPEAQDALGRPGQINILKFSNPGDVEEGAAHTTEALARLEAALADVRGGYVEPGPVQHLGVHPVKRDFVALADEAGELMTSLLLFAGSLTIITGLLLIVNIFTMLAEERRSELGMGRAVGLQRSDVVRLFLFEGSLYAVAAAAVGALLGVGLAYGMVRLLNSFIARFGDGFPPIAYQPTLGAVLVAFAAGAILTFATILVASRIISRLNIVRAIRRIDEPDRKPRWLASQAGLALATAGLVVAVAGWLPSDFAYRFTLQVIGPLALALGLGVWLRRWLHRKPLYPSLAAGLGLYYTVTYFLIRRYDNIREANIVGPIRGVILTLCVVILVVYWETATRALGRVVARLRRMRAVAVPAFSYPQHRRFRTGMTLAMFSIVLLSIGFFSIFGALFQTDPARQSGGFQVEATTTLNVPDIDAYDRGELDARDITVRVDLLDFMTPDVGLITVNGQRTGQFTAPPHHHVYGIDQSFVDEQGFRLLWRLPEYDSDAAAYQALLERDDVVIVGYQYSTNEQNQDLSFTVGDTVQLHIGREPLEFTIIGIQEQWHFGGVFMDRGLVEGLFSGAYRPFYLYKLAPGVDAEEMAIALQRNYQDAGMRAEATEARVLEEQEAFRQILAAMKLFLGLGLIIGVLSLGIVTSRSVIERRQEIGMLRALGFTRGMVRRVFLTEVTVTLAMAAVIGIACSIVVTYGLWFAIIRELQYPYVIPWLEIGVIILVSYVVAVAATVAPIRRAARVAPAEALRYVE